ncbi:MAG: hypothetical protein ACI9MC_000989 [Kiritimatiellia bacterium]|jgi:uncharacterized protein (TIGR02147 family)
MAKELESEPPDALSQLRLAATVKPNVFDYLDHRAFLSDWFGWKKFKNPRFSHRMFARMSGQSNPSLLLQVVQGKRNLTTKSTAGYVKALQLFGRRGDYFRLLVRFDLARTPSERTECYQRLCAMRNFEGAHRIEGDTFRYLSRWHFVAVRELAMCEGFRADPAWIADTLRPKITATQAQEALTLLTDLGLLSIDGKGVVAVHDSDVTTDHEVSGLAAYNYHQAMLGLAHGCLDRVEARNRHVGAVTIAVPQSALSELKAELAALQERLLHLAAQHASADCVYQVTLQLFPLSTIVTVPTEEAP